MISWVKSYISRLLPRNVFARGVSVLVGGTAGAQVLLVLAAPLLTRIYGPDDFGLLAVFSSLLALGVVISSLRYELAIPLPEDDGEAANIAVLSLVLVLSVTVCTSILIMSMGPSISAVAGVPMLAGYLWLLPVGVLLTGFFNIFNSWAVRRKRFTAIAGTKLRQALVTISIQLAAFKFGGIALLFGQVAGQGMGTTTLGLPALKSAEFHNVSWQGMKKAALRYRRFPCFSTWAGLANTAGQQLPPIMLAAIFSPVAAGLFALALRVLSLPMSLIGRSISQVFFSSAAESYRQGKLAPLVASLHSKLAHTGLPIAMVLILLGPGLFETLFGAPWRQAGEFARWLAPWLYLVFVTVPLSTVSTVTEQQKQGLAYHLIQLVARVIAIAVGGWMDDLVATVVLFATASGLCQLGYLLWLARISGNLFSAIWQPTLAAFGFSLFATAPIWVGLSIIEYNPLGWSIALLLTMSIVAIRYWFLLREAY